MSMYGIKPYKDGGWWSVTLEGRRIIGPLEWQDAISVSRILNDYAGRPSNDLPVAERRPDGARHAEAGRHEAPGESLANYQQ